MLLYGPYVFSVEDDYDGNVILDFGHDDRTAVLTNFIYEDDGIKYTYEFLSPAESQNVDSAGATISISLQATGHQCSLQTSYTLPRKTRDSWPANVYFAALCHEIIDFA